MKIQNPLTKMALCSVVLFFSLVCSSWQILYANEENVLSHSTSFHETFSQHVISSSSEAGRFSKYLRRELLGGLPNTAAGWVYFNSFPSTNCGSVASERNVGIKTETCFVGKNDTTGAIYSFLYSCDSSKYLSVEFFVLNS